MVSAKSLAWSAVAIEQDVIGEAVGIQEPIMAAFGGFRIFEVGRKEMVGKPTGSLPGYLQAFE